MQKQFILSCRECDNDDDAQERKDDAGPQGPR